MPGLYLLINTEGVPKDPTSFVTATSKPAMIEAISITVTTPIITPITVRNERSLFARKVASAIHKFSRMSDRKSFIANSLIRSQLEALQLGPIAPLSMLGKDQR